MTEQPIKHVQLIWNDISNITRTRVVTKKRYDQIVAEKGLSLTSGILSFPLMYDMLIEDSPAGEVTLLPDQSTLKRLPWLTDTAIVLCDFLTTKSQQLWERYPRTFLKNKVSELSAYGASVTLGFELEFCVSEKGKPLDTTVYAEAKALRGKGWKVLSTIVETLEDLRIPVWQYHPESAHGQLEIAIGPFVNEPVKAADSLVLARHAIYSICENFGFNATLIPKPFAAQAGNSNHTHISVQTKDGDSAELTEQFSAGVLDHLPVLFPLIAPTPNSYARIVPQCWAGAFKFAGYENKEAPIRLIRNNQSSVGRFEVKTPDGTASPYFIVGGLLAAGIDGIKRKMVLPKEINVEPTSLPEEERPDRLPATLEAAINVFSTSEFMKNQLGDDLFKRVVAIRRFEDNHFKPFSSEETTELLRQRY
ncbi:hypothetical protein HDV04_001713 [Boothiomyces sp. JEL0838]|nr:hypothetical protein HDV04_001713 [Boothiomyces sp. JEL0838]